MSMNITNLTQFKKLTTFGEAFIFKDLTFPFFQQLFITKGFNSSLIAIGAYSQSKPIGLALIKLLTGYTNNAELLSLFVLPPFRRSGIAYRLLLETESELSKLGYNEIFATYVNQCNQESIFEKLIAKCLWNEPEIEQFLYKTDCRLLEAHWIKNEPPMPKDYSVVPWSDITVNQKDDLVQSQIGPHSWIPEDVNPLKHENDYEPLNSLALLRQGEIVGWLITHRLNPNLIRYTCSYIKPEFQKMGRIIHLFAESVRRHCSTCCTVEGIWSVPVHYSRHQRFIQRHFSPYLISIEEGKGSRKTLKSIC
jgi:GNAT superfamily N-acetyltransferase